MHDRTAWTTSPSPVTTMSTDPRFPIGRFTPPAAFDWVEVRSTIATLRDLPERMAAAVAGLDDGQLDTPYREEGWTVRQVVHHVADSHLNACLRTRLALTAEVPTILAYDEKAWALLPDAAALPVGPSLAILGGLHHRWVALLDSLDEATWGRTMVHPEFPEPIAIWWLAALYDWHSRHHVAHITHLRAREEW